MSEREDGGLIAHADSWFAHGVVQQAAGIACVAILLAAFKPAVARAF